MDELFQNENFMNKISNIRSIAILMATYNGEKYLREQIDSILFQSCTDWTLYIQDDGSQDHTLDIICSYNSDRIVLINNGLTRQGACLNFMSMLNVVESEYYMFCDQDDVWFKDKIEKELHRMKEEEISSINKHLPIIVHTDRTFVDVALNVILLSELNPHGISPDRLALKMKLMKVPDIIAIYTIVGGCTMMMNHAVKEIVFPFINVRMHDSLCAMAVANAGGIISTITESTMYYRIHPLQTCGIGKGKLLLKFLHLFDSYKRNIRGFYIWEVYGKDGLLRFLYYRIRYFLILKFF